MGWGGARPGAGRKPAPEGKRQERRKLPATARTTTAKTATGPRQLQLFDPGAIERIVGLSQEHARQKRRAPEFNPFRLPDFPPGAIPPKASGLRMAMDESSIDWAGTQWAGGLLGGAAAEGLTFLGYNYLSELSQRPEYRTPIETISTEMTRKWIKFSSSGTTDPKDTDGETIEEEGETDQEGPKPPGKKPPTDKQNNATAERIKELTDFLDDLRVRDKFADLAAQDGLFGRTHLFLDSGASDEELKTAISESYTNKLLRGKVARRWLKRLQVIEPIWTYPTTYNATNPTSVDWYNPQVWYVMGRQIHRSRIPTFVGRPVPDLLKPSYAFGGLALSQIMKPYVDIWLTTRQSVADLIHSFSVMVLSTDLETLLAPGNANALTARAVLFNALRDNQGLMMLNKGTEEFQNVSAPLSGLHELQAQAQEHMLSVSRIPAVKAFGIQPQGLNASSEGEMRSFNDTIKAYQHKLFKPNLDYVIDIAMITLWGKRDPDIVYEFESLVELTEKERGELRKLKAETGQIHIESGVIDPGEERRRVIEDTDSDYHGLDPEDVPDLKQEEEEGLVPGKGGGAVTKELAGGGDDDDEGGGRDAAILPFGEDAEFSEEDHPRAPDGKFGSGGGGGSKGSGKVAKTSPRASPGHGKASGERQSLRMPQFGLTPKPSASHQNEPDDGSEYFKKNWAKSNSVGGYNQPTEKQIKAYTEAYENQGEAEPATATSFEATMAKPALKVSKLKKIGDNLGSNPGGTYQDADGNKFYIKDSHTPDHAKSELLAANLYALAGSPILRYRAVEGGGKVATEWQTPTEKNASKFTPEQKREAQENFATHAWLANWDAAGLKYDNQNIIDGKATTVDVGGSLAYRAQGEPKGAAWGNSVGEWDTLRDPKRNVQNANFFGDMTAEQMKKSAEKVTRIPNAAIVEAVKANGMGEDMAKRLIARKRDIAAKVGLQAADHAMDFEHAAAVRAIGAIQAQDRLFDNPDLDTAYWIASTSPAARQRRDESVMVEVNPHSITRGGGGGPPPDDEDVGVAEDETDAHGHEHAGPGPGGGQFVAQGGGGGSETEEEEDGGEKEEAAVDIEALLKKPAIAGGNYRRALLKAIKATKDESQKGLLTHKLIASWEKTHANAIKKGQADVAAKIAKKIKALGGNAPESKAAAASPTDMMTVGPPVKTFENSTGGLSAYIYKQQNGKFTLSMEDADSGKTVGIQKDIASLGDANTKAIDFINAGEKPANPLIDKVKAEVAKALKEPPTAEELKKAAKGTTLPPSMMHAGMADAVVKFNEKYAGKNLADKTELMQKIAEYKAIKAGSDALNAASQAEQAAAAETAKKKQQEIAKQAAAKAAEKQKAAKEQAKAEHDKVAKELGISDENEIFAFGAFIEHFGGMDSALSKFKSWEKEAQSAAKSNPGHGFEKLSGFEMACIKAYTGPQSGWINKAVINDSVTPAQYMFEKVLNKALDKLPKKTGLVRRGLSLTPDVHAKLQPGKIWTHRNFASSSTEGWSGNTKLHIEATGKSGSYVAPISSHKGEGETLFQSNLRLLIDKTESKDGVLHVYCKEM